MATYVLLIDFTDQGRRGIKETVDRAEAFWQMAEKHGVKVRDEYWTLGAHDIVVVAEAPDDQSLAALLVEVAALGNITTTTLRGFSADEMRGIIERAG